MKEWLDENFKDMDPKEFVSIFNSSANLKLLIFWILFILFMLFFELCILQKKKLTKEQKAEYNKEHKNKKSLTIILCIIILLVIYIWNNWNNETISWLYHSYWVHFLIIWIWLFTAIKIYDYISLKIFLKKIKKSG